MAKGKGSGEGSGFGVGAGLMRCVLIVVNVFFGLIGFVLLAAGCFIRLGESVYMPFVDDAVGSLPELMSSTGLSDGSEQPDDVSVDFGMILDPLSTGLIVLGLFLFIMGILGCISACCQVKVIMIVYVIVLIILFLLELVLLILYATQGIGGVVESTLISMIEEDYGGIDDYGVESLLLNVIMVHFKCCGAKNYQDFDNAKKWDRMRSFTYQGITVTQELMTPIACCKFEGSIPSISLEDEMCAIKPLSTDLNNNMNKGCVVAIEEEVDSFQTIIIGVLAGIVAFQAILIIFVIALLVIKSKEDGKVHV